MNKLLIKLLLPLGLVGMVSVWAGGGATTVQYTCAKGTPVQAIYAGQHARLVVSGRVLEMDTARSGSGVRYVGGGYTWWTKGPKADLYRGTNPAALTPLDSCQAR